MGRSVEILVEGPSNASSKRPADGSSDMQLTGRTECDRIVVFDGPEELIGRIITVRIAEVNSFTLFGEI